MSGISEFSVQDPQWVS